MSHESLLTRDDTVLVLIDVQEKLLPAIERHEDVLRGCRILVEAAGILDIPVIVTEQYSKGLGPTVTPLAELLGETPRYEKMSFSCAGSDAFLDRIEEEGRSQTLLCGIETHVCVMQTALDLIESGQQVHVAADAVGSRNPDNKRIALERMAADGVVVTCVESALFELLRVAGGDAFKAISKLIR